jgi:hypothetical protein
LKENVFAFLTRFLCPGLRAQLFESYFKVESGWETWKNAWIDKQNSQGNSLARKSGKLYGHGDYELNSSVSHLIWAYHSLVFAFYDIDLFCKLHNCVCLDEAIITKYFVYYLLSSFFVHSHFIYVYDYNARKSESRIPLQSKNNSCEFINHILKLNQDGKPEKMPELINKIHKEIIPHTFSLSRFTCTIVCLWDGNGSIRWGNRFGSNVLLFKPCVSFSFWFAKLF